MIFSRKVELTTRIELVTSSLPRKYSTTEPRERKQPEYRGSTCVDKWSGRRGSNSRPPAWKAGALPTELHPLNMYIKSGGAGRIRTFEGISRQIYSLLPLATREPRQNIKNGADHRSRTCDRRFTKPMLYQLS